MQGVPDLETQHIVSRNWDGMVCQGRENKGENTRGTATEEKSNKNLPQALHLTYFYSKMVSGSRKIYYNVHRL